MLGFLLCKHPFDHSLLEVSHWLYPTQGPYANNHPRVLPSPFLPYLPYREHLLFTLTPKTN